MSAENGAAPPGEDRREDHGRTARKDRKVRTEHVLGGLLVTFFTGGQVKAILSSSDSAAAATALATDVKGLSTKWDNTDAKLTALQLALAEMRARGDAGDERLRAVMAELISFRSELRDLRDGSVRSSTRSEEHERRISALEGAKK